MEEQKDQKPGWKIRIETRIEAIRKTLSHTYTLLQCLKTNKYTNTSLQLRGAWKNNTEDVLPTN